MFAFSGCKKASDWLNEPRTKKDKTFNTLNDYQELLNNTSIFNVCLPTIGLIGSDNIFVRDRYIQTLQVIDRNSYLWNKEIFDGKTSFEYNFGYQAINYSNVVLDGIEKLGRNSANANEFDFIKGQAQFFRALFYFELAGLFCKPYFAETANTDKGLCLRRSPDINEKVKRSTVSETYNLILEDALNAAELLSENTVFKTQPSKTAAYLLLARIYLNMADYENAKRYSDSSLSRSSALIDFNTVPNLNLPYRFPDFKGQNPEIVFYAQGNLYQTIYPSDNVTYSLVDTVLYRHYDLNDLRRVFFYREFDSASIKFRGGYTGAANNFCGLGINEAVLTRAESNARLGRLDDAKRDLNELLNYRYKRGTYIQYESTNPDSILGKILLERRKELPFTGNIRWQDLRRLNLDPSLATPIFRKINDVIKELKPNDSRYVYPIPQSEINITGVEQNIR